MSPRSLPGQCTPRILTAESHTRRRQVVIVGGGPAGCATALALSRRGITGVLLVEATDYGRVRIGESVPPEIRLLLAELGVWQDFLEQQHEPCLGSCSLWGSETPGYNDFLLNPHGTGWHLDRRQFDAWLAQQAAAAGVEIWRETRCHRVESMVDSGERRFKLHLRSAGESRTLEARFVVDATGSHSRVARALGSRPRFHDRLSYLATFVRPRDCANFPRLTLLEAVAYGWWYAARLPAGQVAVAVASDPKIVKERALHQAAGWFDALQATRLLSQHLTDCEPAAGRLIARNAPSLLLQPVGEQGWLAVGDAAGCYDPISSQGIYKALLDGLQAAAAIADGLQGDTRKLAAYPALLASRFDDYLGNRNFLYDQEQRWPRARFWARRHQRRELDSAKMAPHGFTEPTVTATD